MLVFPVVSSVFCANVKQKNKDIRECIQIHREECRFRASIEAIHGGFRESFAQGHLNLLSRCAVTWLLVSLYRQYSPSTHDSLHASIDH